MKLIYFALVATLLIVAKMASADVHTRIEYRAYCTNPGWTGPWLSYRWNAEEYRQERMRNFKHGYCGIEARRY